MQFALCALWSSSGLRCSASWPVWTSRTIAVAWTMLVLLVILHLALFLRLLEYFICRSRRRHWQWYVLAGFAGYDTPRALFFDVAIPQVQSLSRFTCLWLWLVFWPDSAEYCGDSTVAVWTRLFLPVVGQRLVLIPDSAGRYSFVGKFVWLAGLLLSPARQGRCGRM